MTEWLSAWPAGWAWFPWLAVWAAAYSSVGMVLTAIWERFGLDWYEIPQIQEGTFSANDERVFGVLGWPFYAAWVVIFTVAKFPAALYKVLALSHPMQRWQREIEERTQ